MPQLSLFCFHNRPELGSSRGSAHRSCSGHVWGVFACRSSLCSLKAVLAVGFMEMSHSPGLLLASFVFLALSYCTVDEQSQKMH